MLEHHQIIIVGAGPGGLSVAVALQELGLKDVLVLDEGEIGQSWLDYPDETHLITNSTLDSDDNMVAGIPTSEVFPNISHPSHEMYQKYLAHVVRSKKIEVTSHTHVEHVNYDPQQKIFILECPKDGNDNYYTCNALVWAAGMFTTPNDGMDCEGCFVHYARMPYMDSIDSDEITVVGSANGASGVVLELARPGRLITVVTSHPYEVPQPVDCLWKEQMQFIKDLQMQGMVKIVENFRVKRIYGEEGKYILESESGQTVPSKKRPIICTGFVPNIKPIESLVSLVTKEHECYLDLDVNHQSKKQPGLYVAGAIGKMEHDQGVIAKFREFAKPIAQSIQQSI